MKAKAIFLLVLLSLVAVSGVSYAGKDPTGSSTVPGIGNKDDGRSPRTETHSGQSIRPATRVGSTDAQGDAHPLI